MTESGPPLAELTHRLADCTPEFLAEPRIGEKGVVRVGAVVSDVLVLLAGESLPEARNTTFAPSGPADRNRQRVVLVASWLLAAPWFRGRARVSERALAWLTHGLADLASVVEASTLVSDAERREELARRCLDALGLRPEGEGEEQAADRLATLDSVERARVVRATAAAQQRARKLREELAKKAAAEAAAKVTRE